ncbi:hypothetical protein RHGRI_015114 [Rhododendron griersonianum]|uniref:Transmembrane protein n=1 Tax=Rhododendron griersonianum TaxID=479676 RepID=A0AAV6KCG6_9ERIC|nr:hypothetical protein RHGRI_015114 [Rhododendron griersonianum]
MHTMASYFSPFPYVLLIHASLSQLPRCTFCQTKNQLKILLVLDRGLKREKQGDVRTKERIGVRVLVVVVVGWQWGGGGMRGGGGVVVVQWWCCGGGGGGVVVVAVVEWWLCNDGDMVVAAAAMAW